MNWSRNAYLFLSKTALEVILSATNKDITEHILIQLGTWIADPKFSSNEFMYLKNTLFLTIAAGLPKNKTNYHHANLKIILDKKQSNNKKERNLYFVPQVIKKFDGMKVMESLSVNDIALTCIALINCVEIYSSNLPNCDSDTESEQPLVDTTVKTYGNNNISTPSLSQDSTFQDDCSETSHASSWNSCYRNKPSINDYILSLESFATKMKMGENFDEYKIYTGARKYTGGKSGSGHSWLLSGVYEYERVRKLLIKEMHVFRGL